MSPMVSLAILLPSLLSAAFLSGHHCLGVMMGMGLIWNLEQVNFNEDNDFWGG